MNYPVDSDGAMYVRTIPATREHQGAPFGRIYGAILCANVTTGVIGWLAFLLFTA